MPNKPLRHSMTSHKITQDGSEGGKKNETVQNRSKGKLTRNETQNSYGLIQTVRVTKLIPFNTCFIQMG